MKKNILITGANRGLGLEFTQQYLEEGHRVFAGCRNPEEAHQLQNIQKNYADSLSIIKLDVNSADDIATIKNQLHDIELDLLINNAGVYGPKNLQFGHISKQDWMHVLQTNSIAPVLISQAFIRQLLPRQGKLVFITSRMGSIGDNQAGANYMYRSSKAALNAACKSLAIDLEADGIPVLILHPGWVATDMGGPNAWIDTKQSIAGMKKIIEHATLKDSGVFYHYDGSILPW